MKTAKINWLMYLFSWAKYLGIYRVAHNRGSGVANGNKQ